MDILLEYNSDLWKIMLHYNIESEYELLTGYVVNLSKLKSPHGGKNRDEIQKKINQSIRNLWKKYHSIFWDSLDSNIDRCDITTMHNASAWYNCTYKQKVLPIIFYSFPWIVYPILCRIIKSKL